jgi:hypothetical protein
LAQVPFFANTQSWLIKLSFDEPALCVSKKSDKTIKKSNGLDSKPLWAETSKKVTEW